MDGVGAGEDREQCPAWAGRTQTPRLWVPPSHFLSRGSHPYDGVCKVTCGPKRAHLSSSAQRNAGSASQNSHRGREGKGIQMGKKEVKFCP